CFTDRWRSMLCSDRSCCPADGTPIDLARGDRIAAEFVAEGVSVRSGRDALATACAPLPDSDPAAVLFRAALASQAASSGADWATAVAPQERQQRAEQCVQTLVGGGDADASVALALADIRVRDAVIRMLTHDEGADERRRAEANLIATMRVSPRDLRAPIATVAAGLAWQRGDGAIGADCLEVALDADPDYSLARLLRRALCNAVPPNVWVTAVGQTTVDECLTGSNGRQ
ncbi:MAG: DUF4192 domain-containing protein, partial [Actinobacteria bacterium]|nr:DUF4192 domain-containing protein [Actinomycetota bacterium]